MKICFVCCRPFQVLNAINYIESVLKVKTEHEFEIDFFISKNYKKQFDLDSLGYVRKIYYFEEVIWKSKIKKLGDYLFLKRTLIQSIEECCINQIDDYDEIYGTSYNGFFVRLCNINKKSSVIFLEDGIGTYMNDDYQKHLNSRFSNLLKYFNRGVLAIEVRALYCYHPELMCLKKNYPILNLPLLDYSLLLNLNKAFNNKGINSYNRSIIYFTSDVTWEEKYKVREADFLEAIYEYKDQMIVRLHPNRHDEINNEIDKDDSEQLWELCCREIDSRNILIGIFSTAQFSPYMLYGKQYSVVFLYKMVFQKDSYLYQQCEKTVNLLKKEFPRIYVPNTIPEYKSLVKNLLSGD